jgi:hypothetical protein
LYGSAPKALQADSVSDGETVTRYILSRKHISVSKGVVKYGAYMPAPDGETSVYRTFELAEKEIWAIGQSLVASPTNRTLYARGDTTVAVVKNTGLRVVPETTLHPLHANIVGWPKEKGEQKVLAIELANEARLALPGDGTI